MDKSNVDYSLYLVTDSTPAILGNKDLADVVSEAIEGGVTIVQYRDKTSDTAALISTAKRLHTITQRKQIPLLINDRVDVALAVGCEGVHVGQDDLDFRTARKLLGQDAIIGVSASNVVEAVDACRNGAEYLGIGTLFATPTKTNTKHIIGTFGAQKILQAIGSVRSPIPTVAIGGINATNIQRVLYQSASSLKPLSGVAIVSAIMASPTPRADSSHLKLLISTPPPFASSLPSSQQLISASQLVFRISDVIRGVSKQTPLVHNITNTVTAPLLANICLALGSSPIMSSHPLESPDLAKHNGSLLINIGTLSPTSVDDYVVALKAYNAVGGPVILDPVGVGATSVRKEAVRRVMSEGYFSVIKGNCSEILAISALHGSRTELAQRGVDSSPSSLSSEDKAYLVKALAEREKNIVVMTGIEDYISDGRRIYKIQNGHELLAKMTGSGCALGTIVAGCVAVERGDQLLAALAGTVLLGVAAERAAARPEVRGPGTFVQALIDEIYILCKEAVAGNEEWLEAAKVEQIEKSQ